MPQHNHVKWINVYRKKTIVQKPLLLLILYTQTLYIYINTQSFVYFLFCVTKSSLYEDTGSDIRSQLKFYSAAHVHALLIFTYLEMIYIQVLFIHFVILIVSIPVRSENSRPNVYLNFMNFYNSNFVITQKAGHENSSFYSI